MQAATGVSYIVGSVPRSGSTLLCELLAATRLAGSPGEFFSPYTMRVSMDRWGARTLEEYVQELFARETGGNGVFGAKAHWAQYESAFGGADPRPLFPGLRWVYITRRDRVRQAVSWVRAQQTGQFHAQDPARADDAVFDHERIAQMLRRIGREEQLWESLFERHRFEPHRVVYEDLVADREAAVRGVLALLEVEAPADLHIPQPALERQADRVSDQWVERYLAEAATSPGPAPGGA